MKRIAATLLILIAWSGAVLGQSLRSEDFTLVGADGTYLGCFTKNKYDSESIFNEYGTYGSKYSGNSIWNDYGQYGSKYSNLSAFNTYASEPPLILYRGQPFGRLTLNRYLQDAVNPFSFVMFLRDKTY